MTTELGIGTRVWVEWRPDNDLQEGLRDDPRCRTGTIVDGPWLPLPYASGDGFALIPWQESHPVWLRYWSVVLDGSTDAVESRESRLHPVDGDEDAWDRERERIQDQEVAPPKSVVYNYL